MAEYGRRVTPADTLTAQVPPNKLEQKAVNFENIANEGLGNGKFDVVVITCVHNFHSRRLREILTLLTILEP